MSSIPSTNTLIWLSVKPIIRIAIPCGAGFTLIKTGVIPGTATRPFSLLVLNLTLPCLLFSKIVPSLSSQNISALGPIILTAFFYQFLTGAIGVVVRAFTQTPRRFRYGIISSYLFSNWGDLPTAVLQTITASSPFAGSADESLAIAFVAIFILVNYVTMFPLQGLRFVRFDYDKSMEIDREEERKYERGEYGLVRKWLNRAWRGKPMQYEMDEWEKERNEEKLGGKGKGKAGEEEEAIDMARAMQEEMAVGTSTALPVRPRAEPFPELAPVPSFSPSRHSSASNHPSAAIRVLHSITSFLRSLVSPPTVALLSGLIIAIVPNLKALFYYTDDTSFHPTAPDGDPPLSIIYQTALFIGNASVPLGLFVLGASMAKMVIPRPISRLPIAGIFGMAIVKVVLLPIIGFFFVKQLVNHTGMVGRDDKVLRLVLIYFSCVPTGTIQIAYSQIFGPPEGPNNSELLSAYILVQYGFFVFSSVILTALTLNSLF